jgi:hypothetical protein
VIMFAPRDNTRLLTIGVEDNTVRIWDVAHFLKANNDKGPVLSLDELRKQARTRLPIRGSDHR